MNRQIAHIDLDSFFVSVERVKDPTLIGKPVIVGGSSNRGVVSSCSYEARAFGVRSAMPTVQAARLCPHAIFVRGDISGYSHYSRLVTQIITANAPLVEKASIDEFYLDLSGMERFFGVWQIMLGLKETIRAETGLPISFALAGNKLISKIATNEAKPNGQIAIPAGTEQAYLAPMPLSKIPGVGEKTLVVLKQAGLHTCAHVTESTPQILERLLGKWGTDLHRKCNGIDTSPVVSLHEQKSISSEETFREDVQDFDFLKQELVRLTEKIGYELRQEGKLAGCVAIKLRYENFETITRQATIDYSAADHVFIKAAHDLLIAGCDTTRKIRLIGVKLSQLVGSSPQLSLFENQHTDCDLYKAIDQIKDQFGKGAIYRAGGAAAHGKSGGKDGDDPLFIGKNVKDR